MVLIAQQVIKKKKIEEEQAIKEESDDTMIDFEIHRSGIQKGRQSCGMITQLIY
jgi:hypothetical protein